MPALGVFILGSIAFLTSACGLSENDARKKLYFGSNFLMIGLFENARMEFTELPAKSKYRPEADAWISVIDEVEADPKRFAEDGWRGSQLEKLVNQRLAPFRTSTRD